MKNKKVEIKLPISVWNFFETLSKEKDITLEESLEEYLELFKEKGKISLSKHDKKIFPLAINIWSEMEVLEEQIKSIQATAPIKKKSLYAIILHYLKSAKYVFQNLIDKIETGTGNVLSEKERNRCWDYTLIIEQVNQLILKDQKNISKIEKVLIKELNLQKLK